MHRRRTPRDRRRGRRHGAVATLALVATAATPLPGQTPAATDIHLAPLELAGPHPSVGTPVAVTDRAGYDNQPHFTPDGTALLYTSIGPDGQADTWRYTILDGRRSRLTRTPESEYSPTVMPGDTTFSVVRVEADSAQRLWMFDLRTGGEPRLLLPHIEPVGYHAWADGRTVAVFVLGDPPTLRLARLPTGASTVVARGIGRSLQRIPGGRTISFVHKVDEESWWVAELDPETGERTRLIRTPAGSEDHAWAPDGTLLMARGSRLLAWRRGDDGWTEIADFAPGGPTGITRLAVSPDGRHLALVAARPDGGGG